MEAYEYVLQELLKLPGAKTTSNPNQIRIMCPKCEKYLESEMNTIPWRR